MLAEILKITWWLFFTIIKFIWTPFTLATTTNYTWLEAFLITVGGGWLGIVMFFYFGRWIVNIFSRRRKKPKRRFTKLNRLIAKTKSKYGLTGLVAIIGIISVPLCSLIAAAYFKENRNAVPALMLSVLIWAVCLTAIFYSRSLFF